MTAKLHDLHQSALPLFDIPQDVTYLNCAFMSPLIKSSLGDLHKAIDSIQHPWTITIDSFFTAVEELRTLFAKIIHADTENVAIIPSTSYGISIAAKNCRGDKSSTIVVLEDQFPSNIYSWMEGESQIVTVKKRVGQPLTESVLLALQPGVTVLALPHCHWSDGAWLDLQLISKHCQEKNIQLVVDGTQSVGALDFDVQKIQPDFLICSSYKWLFGPYGVAFLYCSDKHLNGQPIEHNWINRWASEDFANLTQYQTKFQSGARRYDMGGKSNPLTLPIAIDSLKHLLAWGVPSISEYCQSLTDHLAEELPSLGLTCWPKPLRAPHILGIYSGQNSLPADCGAQLKEQGIFVSQRGHSLRVAPYLYNSAKDIENLVTALKQLL